VRAVRLADLKPGKLKPEDFDPKLLEILRG
jgi:hypothetical protein